MKNEWNNIYIRRINHGRYIRLLWFSSCNCWKVKGELRAKDVLLESSSVFDGNLIADKVTLGGLVKGEVAANTLNVSSSARVEGNLKINSLSIDLGAEVAGNISRIS